MLNPKPTQMYKLIILVFLASCMSAPKHLKKAIDKDKPYVAGETRRLWPCTEVKTDTVNTTDTIVDIMQVECPDVTYTDAKGDTVYLPGKKITTQGKTITNTRYIDRYIEDSAKIFVMGNNIEVLTNMYREDTARLNKEVKMLKSKVAKQRGTLTWLWGILILIGLWTAFKIYRKLTLR